MLSFIKRATAVALLVGGTTAGVARAQDVVKIDGSSTVYPVTEAVAEEYQKEKDAAKVTIGISGTGGGFKKFVRGETDISNASRPILAKEQEEARKNNIKYIELPIAFDALTVIINPQNDFAKTLTVADLKKMWAPESQGKVMTWKDIRPEWPATPLKLYGPGADSGTFDYFTEAVVGKAKSSRTDYTGSEDDNIIIQGVAGDKGAIGYLGYAYYLENKDKVAAASIDGGKGPVAPSERAVIDGTYQPLSRPIFIYVSKTALSRPAVKNFAKFYLESATDLTKKVKYVPLPEDIYEKGLKRMEAGQTGSIFGGVAEIGVKITELFEKPLKE